ncbi:hypothetical protein V9T40_013601 [Parthenolecanium corni]|uniref:Uncharacterized protein n=1 Tax=Parthenolecanium corni TaxID=536013 RepID=A0AAN9TBA6_9HEMI
MDPDLLWQIGNFGIADINLAVESSSQTTSSGMLCTPASSTCLINWDSDFLSAFAGSLPGYHFSSGSPKLDALWNLIQNSFRSG